MVVEAAVSRNALRDFSHSLVPLLSHAHFPHGREWLPISRSRCNPAAGGVQPISRRPFVTYQPYLHRSMELAQGIEP